MVSSVEAGNFLLENMFFRGVLCLALAIVGISALPITKEKLRFKLSARGLPDKDNLGTIDPYAEVFYTQGESSSEHKIGRTEAIDDNEHPDWGKVFEFDYDRSKNQQWHFKIWDRDHGREDDKGGQVWVNVNDYVDKGQLINSLLDKQGYLTVRSAEPLQDQQRTSTTPGNLPYSPGSPETAQLKFRVSAKGLKDKDFLGKTDPYAEIYYANGLTGKKTKIGRTATLSGTKNPEWGDTFTVNWDRKKDQRLLVKIYDNDNFREDDKEGLAWLELNDYVAKGQVMSAHLNKQGVVTIHRADGIAPNPNLPAYSPGVPSSVFPSPPINPGQQTPGQQRPGQQFPGPSGPGQQFPSSQFPQGQQFPSSQFTSNQPQQPYRGPESPVGPQSPSKNQQPISPQQPPRSQSPRTIKFKLAGSNLDDQDIIGTSDPYAKVYIKQGDGAETLIKTGSKLTNTVNPQWDDIYEFNYEPNKQQKLRFLILDNDDNVKDDVLGEALLETSELELRPYVILRLPVGSLTVTKV